MSKSQTTDPLYLRTFASVAREDGDEETAVVVEQAADEIERLRKFIQQVADAPDAMVCRLTRDAAKEILDAN